eukprot:jgi/Tetstr1/465032/TSEL_009760.t1
MDNVVHGEIHGVMLAARDRGFLPSISTLLAQLRKDRRAAAIDLLIEAHPEADDGGLSADRAELKGLGESPTKVATHLALFFEGEAVHSMARLAFYCGAGHKVVGVLSAVVTRKSQRRRGLATRVLSSLLDNHSGIAVRLTVDAANAPAVACYRSLGLVPVRGTSRGSSSATADAARIVLERPAQRKGSRGTDRKRR